MHARGNADGRPGHTPAAAFSRDACGGREPGTGWFVVNAADVARHGIPGHAYTALDTRQR